MSNKVIKHSNIISQEVRNTISKKDIKESLRQLMKNFGIVVVRHIIVST